MPELIWYINIFLQHVRLGPQLQSSNWHPTNCRPTKNPYTVLTYDVDSRVIFSFYRRGSPRILLCEKRKEGRWGLSDSIRKHHCKTQIVMEIFVEISVPILVSIHNCCYDLTHGRNMCFWLLPLEKKICPPFAPPHPVIPSGGYGRSAVPLTYVRNSKLVSI